MSARRLLRNSASRLLFLAGLTSPQRQSAGRLTVVTFHRVLPEAERERYPYPGLVATPGELDALLTYFTEHFDCGALAQQHERYLHGKRSARPLLALTFDDAQHDNYLHARPALSRHRVKASFFVPVAAVERQELLWHDRLGFSVLSLDAQGEPGRERLRSALAAAGLPGKAPGDPGTTVRQAKHLALPLRLELVRSLEAAAGQPEPPAFARMMSFAELAELAADGHEIGSHSMTHCMMTECDERSLGYELSESRRVLRKRTGQPIDTFCYPNGNCDERTARAVSGAGYRRAVTTAWGDNDAASDPFKLRRFDMDTRPMRAADGRLLQAMVAFRMSAFTRLSDQQAA